MAKIRIQHSKISFPYCRAYDYEIDNDGMCWAAEYTDKRGRTRYCANPNHNHYYAGGCFIASACYGSTSEEVIILKKFRDKFLLKHRIGELFVNFYYKFSPVISCKVKRQKLYRGFFLVMLKACSVHSKKIN